MNAIAKYRHKLEQEVPAFIEKHMDDCMECPTTHKMAKNMLETLYFARLLTEKVDSDIYYFDEEMAKDWVAKMTPKAKWTMDVTTEVAKQYGVKFDHIKDYEWWVVMNKMYSDHKGTVEKITMDEVLPYVDLAKDYLFDEDSAVTPHHKLGLTYHLEMKH